MIDTLTNPTVLAAGVAAGGIASAAIYSYVTGESTSVSVDPDDDGSDEVTASFGGDTNAAETPDEDGEDDAPNPSKPPMYEVESDGSLSSPKTESSGEVEADKLEDVKGLGSTKADELRESGYKSPEDVYLASDAELEDVVGIGPSVVEQIRSDIGYPPQR